jgi:hypothetical protein
MFLSKVTVPVLKHPVSTALSHLVFYSQSYVWHIIAAFWNFTYIRSSIHGLYVSLLHISVLSFFMALVGDHTLYLLLLGGESEPPHWRYRLSAYGEGVVTQWLIVIGCFAILHLPNFSNWFSRFLHSVGAVLGAAYQSRMFHRLPAFLPKADDRFVLVGALAMMHWVPIVDFVAQKVSRKRAVSRFRKFSLLVQLSIVAAFLFTLSRRSTVARIFGIYPLEFSGVILVVVHAVLYLRA